MTNRRKDEPSKERGCRGNTRVWQALCLLVFIVLLRLSSIDALKTPLEWQEPLVLVDKDKTNDRHAILVYIPGYNVSANDYLPIITLLQQEFDYHNITLLAAIVRFPKLWGSEFPPFIGCDSLVEQAKQKAQEHHDSSEAAVYLGGHSLGSILAQMMAYKRPSEYIGVLIHGGYVMTKYRQQRLPVPTFTLSGTRDGMNRFTYVAMQHKDFRVVHHSSQGLLRSPSILVEGINHYNLANNALPYMEGRDFEERISLQRAQAAVSKLSAAFMLQQLNVTVADQMALEEQMAQSEKRYYDPYIQAMESDASGQTCILAQRLHFENETVSIVAHHPHNKVAFIFAKPKGNQTRVEVKLFAKWAFNWFGRSSVPQAVQTLRCKMITKEQVFGEASIDYDSCASMNAFILRQARFMLPEDMQEAYFVDGRRLEFGDDIEAAGGITWLSRDLEFTPQNNGTTLVQSPRLKTLPGKGRYSGKLYCALLSMSRAMEYIMLDSFPKRKVSPIPQICNDD